MYMIVEVSQYVAVASFSEAWIEIDFATLQRQIDSVASFSEAWIEMLTEPTMIEQMRSPPSRRRGLK